MSSGDRVSEGKTKVCWCYCGGVCVMLVLCRLVMVPVLDPLILDQLMLGSGVFVEE